MILVIMTTFQGIVSFSFFLIGFTLFISKLILEQIPALLMVFVNTRDFQSRHSLLHKIKVPAGSRINGRCLFGAKPGTAGSRWISNELPQKLVRQRTNIVVTVLFTMPGKYLAEAGPGNLCKRSG